MITRMPLVNWSLRTTKHGKILCYFLVYKVIEIKKCVDFCSKDEKMIINMYAIFKYCRSCNKVVFFDLLILFP